MKTKTKKSVKSKKPVGYFGSLYDLPKNDKRIKLFKKQLKERGWDNSELWNLDEVFTRLILPRLRGYRDNSPFEKNTEAAINLNNAIEAFEILERSFDSVHYGLMDPHEQLAVQYGLISFAQVFRSLSF